MEDDYVSMDKFERVCDELDQLVALVKALPKVIGEIDIEEIVGEDKLSRWFVSWQRAIEYPVYQGLFYTKQDAEAYAALLRARKELGG